MNLRLAAALPLSILLALYRSIFNDRRRKVVGVFFVFAWLITLATVWRFWSKMGQSHLAETEKDVFLAWCGELIFFTLIGLAIALVSLEVAPDPTKKDIRERLAIFLGGNHVSDSVRTFLLNQMSETTTYCINAHWDLVIEDYDTALGAYRVRAETRYDYYNPVRDQEARFDVRFSYKPDRLPGIRDDEEVGKYISIKVDDDDKLAGRGPIIIPLKGVSDQLQIIVKPLNRVSVTTVYVVWMAVGHEQLIRPNRFVQLFTLRITNRGKVMPKVAFDKPGDGRESRSLFFAQSYQPAVAQDVPPGIKAFGFWLTPP